MSSTGLGEDLVERGDDAALFRRDVLAAVAHVFPDGRADCIERVEGAGHGSDTLTAVLSPWTLARQRELRDAAAARNMTMIVAAGGTVVGDRGGLVDQPVVLKFLRYRRPRTAAARPGWQRLFFFTLLCIACAAFVHFVNVRERV